MNIPQESAGVRILIGGDIEQAVRLEQAVANLIYPQVGVDWVN
jgi:hypothetical protein